MSKSYSKPESPDSSDRERLGSTAPQNPLQSDFEETSSMDSDERYLVR
jgi:hypothetical protein